MSVLRSNNNKTPGGLGRVCATGMYRSIEHAKFQTGIVVEWKAPFDWMWPINMAIEHDQQDERLTGQLPNQDIGLDIVCWPTIISNPAQDH